MEYWGIEVKAGETIKVQPGDGMVVHLSQAGLGEIKKDKGKDLVNVFVNVDGKKLVLCTLSLEKFPQQPFDLVFDRDFELSHNLKSGSVSFFGYKARNPLDDEDKTDDSGSDSDSYSESSDDEIPLTVENNGKTEVKAKEEKTTDAKKSDDDKVSALKKKGKEAIIKDDSDDSTSNDQDTDTDEDDDDSDSDDSEDSSDGSDSEEETPAKVEPEKKKRSSDPEPKTPVANKKVKLATPQKTDGKSGGTSHVATPHPSKKTATSSSQNEKKPATSSSQKTPKSAGGSHVCKSCSRTFGSETGLESHTKAKHSAAK